MRDATDAEIPGGARQVRKLAETHGWLVRATYARGTTPDRRVRKEMRPGKVVDSLALRMRRGRERAVAVWIDAKFDVAYTWGLAPRVRWNSGQLREQLTAVAG